uniref:Protein kinase domain-containing protein n=1 Tax=Macrostomum lignano TaxID=282301 RepID=A0A1I8FNE7_9PLAT
HLFLERWDAVRLIGAAEASAKSTKVRTDTGVTCAAKTLRLPCAARFLHIARPEPAAVVVFMELLDGRSLERFIDNTPLDELTIREFSQQSPKGTLNFMAPELLGAGESDSVQYSRESDIWAVSAFGCSVFPDDVWCEAVFKVQQPMGGARAAQEERGAPALPDGRSAELRDFYSRCTARTQAGEKIARRSCWGTSS